METKEKTILIVDDEEDIRELVEITLEDSRYCLHTAGDGETGLEAIQQHSPDLVILDWMMPRLNGLEVVRKLRGDPATASTRVVILTSSEDRDGLEELRSLGIVSYLRKPFSPLELIQTVHEALTI